MASSLSRHRSAASLSRASRPLFPAAQPFGPVPGSNKAPPSLFLALSAASRTPCSAPDSAALPRPLLPAAAASELPRPSIPAAAASQLLPAERAPPSAPPRFRPCSEASVVVPGRQEASAVVPGSREAPLFVQDAMQPPASRPTARAPHQLPARPRGLPTPSQADTEAPASVPSIRAPGARRPPGARRLHPAVFLGGLPELGGFTRQSSSTDPGARQSSSAASWSSAASSPGARRLLPWSSAASSLGLGGRTHGARPSSSFVPVPGLHALFPASLRVSIPVVSELLPAPSPFPPRQRSSSFPAFVLAGSQPRPRRPQPSSRPLCLSASTTLDGWPRQPTQDVLHQLIKRLRPPALARRRLWL